MQPSDESDSPSFEHDCACCLFLGRYAESDLYFCDREPDRPTVVARFGNDEQDYTTGMRLCAVDPRLAEAHWRAIRRGLMQNHAAARPTSRWQGLVARLRRVSIRAARPGSPTPPPSRCP